MPRVKKTSSPEKSFSLNRFYGSSIRCLGPVNFLQGEKISSDTWFPFFLPHAHCAQSVLPQQKFRAGWKKKIISPADLWGRRQSLVEKNIYFFFFLNGSLSPSWTLNQVVVVPVLIWLKNTWTLQGSPFPIRRLYHCLYIISLTDIIGKA